MLHKKPNIDRIVTFMKTLQGYPQRIKSVHFGVDAVAANASPAQAR